MSCTERSFDSTPEQIWSVLADPHSYEHWVVGAKDIRAADGEWPAPGSALQHTSGFGPLNLKDNTKVLEADPPRRLVLEARGRPLGIARIEIELKPEGAATAVSMTEYAIRPEAARRLNPILDPFLHSRNVETLRRLEELIKERTAAPTA
ncbi:MAG: SRPBCC domain-containing protein [Acidimicrobiales bacterium]